MNWINPKDRKPPLGHEVLALVRVFNYPHPYLVQYDGKTSEGSDIWNFTDDHKDLSSNDIKEVLLWCEIEYPEDIS